MDILRSLTCSWSLAATALLAPAQDLSSLPGPARAPGAQLREVVFDSPSTGTIWALGNTYKASFGSDGFAYVPFLGSAAPRNYPVRFVLRGATIGSAALALPDAPALSRDGARVVLGHGEVREIYDLTLEGVAQSFELPGDRPGDVEVTLELQTDLSLEAAGQGLRFSTGLGSVEYGAAHLVVDGEVRPIVTELDGQTLRLRVPAALRGQGTVRIDPLITTRTLAPTLLDSAAPDLAYDASNDRWLVTWAHVFSATDHDVIAEMRTGSGDPVPGSIMGIDLTTTLNTLPHVANLNGSDRFLIVMDRLVVARYQVWGRTVNAAAPFVPGPDFAVSPSIPNSHQHHADVGGDSGQGDRWTVVWVRDGDTIARQVDAGGTPLPNVILIETGVIPSDVPQISQSNGNGFTALPRWCIVYMLYSGAGNRDIQGATMDLLGNVGGAGTIAGGAQDDQSPYVSSPLFDARGDPTFVVCYERHGTSQEMQVQVFGPALGRLVPEVNLTRRFAFSGLGCRVESDGCRIAAACRLPSGLALGTLAVIGSDLVLHESPQVALDGDSPALASKRSSAGPLTDYALAYQRLDLTPRRIGLTVYRGHASGSFRRRPTGCGLPFSFGGEATLGGNMSFTVTNPGTGWPFQGVGLPIPATPLCGTCLMGLDFATAPLVTPALSMGLTVPMDVRLVGAIVSVQAAVLGIGPCAPAAIALSDTVDITIQ